MTKQDPIAVFDSGVGGISVLRHLVKELPQETFVYFGDSANAPYGSRPTEEVRELTLRAVEKLVQERNVKAIVVACNTATAAAVAQLRALYPERIVIGIEPALKLAADRFPGGRIGVMATEVTLREGKFDQLLHRYDQNCSIFKIPAPGLVPLIERGLVEAPETEALLHSLLDPYVGKLDALVLGCTHYPFAAGLIGKILGPEVALLEGGPGTALQTRRRLAQAGLLSEGPGDVILLNSSQDPEMLKLSRERLYQER